MTTPYDPARLCLMQKTRRAARQLTAVYEDAFSAVGLTGGQFSILVAASIQDRAPITPFAESLGMDRTTLSRGLRPLERRGLIEIRQDEADGRTRVVTLTEEGRRVLEQALPLWAEAQARAEGALKSMALEPFQRGLAELGRL